MDYDQLPPADRVVMLDNQIAMYEREYFTITEVTPVDGSEARIAWLETEVARLKVLRDSLSEAATPNA